MSARILVVEDEKDIRDLIHFNLYKEGYDVILARNGDEAVNLVREKKPDLVLLDVMLPAINGFDVCKIIRGDKNLENVAIIMLTAKGLEQDVVEGLNCGADDYITKPFGPKVLLARINAQLRKRSLSTAKDAVSDTLVCHGIEIDENKRVVRLDGIEIELTYSEFQILLIMAKKPGWVFSRSQLVNLLRGDNHAITDRSVDVQIVGLRKKIQDNGQIVQTVRGVGYKMKELS